MKRKGCFKTTKKNDIIILFEKLYELLNEKDPDLNINENNWISWRIHDFVRILIKKENDYQVKCFAEITCDLPYFAGTEKELTLEDFIDIYENIRKY